MGSAIAPAKGYSKGPPSVRFNSPYSSFRRINGEHGRGSGGGGFGAGLETVQRSLLLEGEAALAPGGTMGTDIEVYKK